MFKAEMCSTSKNSVDRHCPLIGYLMIGMSARRHLTAIVIATANDLLIIVGCLWLNG